jgi:DHA1 family tetracycline resistance protein-like MFS transporter
MAESKAIVRRASMIWVLVTLFLDVLGLAFIIPILPGLVGELAGDSSASVARFYGLIAAAYALMQFLFAPLLGALSDRYGRRPVLLASIFGSAVSYLLLAFAPTLAWLVIGRLIAGVAGSSLTTVNAYIADVSTPETRAQNFGLVGVAFGLGFIFGPAFGGVLGALDLRLPFFVAAGFSALNGLYGLFILPESLPLGRRSAFRWRRANPVGSIGALGAYPLVGGLALAFVFVSLAQRGLESTWVLYTSYRFGWGEATNGLTLGLVGLMAVFVQGFLIRPVVRRFGERRTVIVGLSISATSYLLFGLATAGWMMLFAIVVGAFGGVAGPAIQGLVAGSVSPEGQGKVQGALASLTSLTSIVAPVVFTAGLFGFFTSPAAPFVLPGAPFFLGSLLLTCGLGLAARLFRRVPPAKPVQKPVAQLDS